MNQTKGNSMRGDVYRHFVNVLDQIRAEAPLTLKSYHPPEEDIEKVNQARSRAFVHLFLLARFGLTSFPERESLVTDGTGDAGIDGYFIDRESRQVFFVQAKFRTSNKGFEEREIRFEEILSMDINRVLEGERVSEDGSKYNGRILKLIEEIQSIDDIGRYSYRVVILANTKSIPRQKLVRLTGGFSTEVLNYQRCYSELLFPILTGTFYQSETLFLHLNLSNKQSGSKISYKVETSAGPVEITVVFVPTLEIAKAMGEYRNAILKFNPRCFLEFSESNINTEIAESITGRTTNEFSLFNNGITMLSDDTSINEKIGYRDKAQLVVRNPQIINGGQTAFALYRLLESHPKHYNEMFEGKEALVKIITMNSEAITSDEKIRLIEEISNATNKQNEVTYADRHSNDRIQLEIQRKLFTDHGVLYERKRGEFADALKFGFIAPEDILTRSQLLRISRTIAGDLNRNQSGKKFFNNQQYYGRFFRVDHVAEYHVGHLILQELRRNENAHGKRSAHVNRALHQGTFLLLFVIYRYVDEAGDKSPQNIAQTVESVLSRWLDFERSLLSLDHNKGFFHSREDKVTGETRRVFDYRKYYRSKNVIDDMMAFFRNTRTRV